MQEMAGSDGRQLPPLRDLSRRAASFLRMARLALTGAATPAQPLAREEVVDGHSCDPYYKSVRTENDWESELWPEGDESELLVDDEDRSTSMRGGGVLENNSSLVGVGGGGPMNKKSRQTRDRPATTTAGAAFRSEHEHVTAAEVEEPSETLMMMPRRAPKQVNDAVAVVDHPFGCDRQGSESSSLLLVSS